MTYTNIDSLTSQSRIVLSSLSFKGKGSRSLHLCHPPTPFKETSWSWRHSSQGQVLRHFRFGIDIMAVGEKTEHSTLHLRSVLLSTLFKQRKVIILEKLKVYLLSAPMYLYGTFPIQDISQFLPTPPFCPARPNSEGLLSCEELKHKFSPSKIQNAGSTTEPKRKCRSVEKLFFAMI